LIAIYVLNNMALLGSVGVASIQIPSNLLIANHDFTKNWWCVVKILSRRIKNEVAAMGTMRDMLGWKVEKYYQVSL